MNDGTVKKGLKTRIPRLRHHRGKASVQYPDCELSEFLCDVAEAWEMYVSIPEDLIGRRVSVFRKNVDWSDLFDFVLTPLGYDWFMERDVIRIAIADHEVEPLYTDFQFHLYHTKVLDVESILRLFLNPYDKESMEVLAGGRDVRFHVRKSRLESLTIFVENLDEAFNPDPSDGTASEGK